MNTKRLFALLLAAGMLLSLAACSSDTTASDNDTADNGGDAASVNVGGDDAAVTSAEVSYYPEIDGVDYDGRGFNLLYFSNELSHGWTDIPTDMNPTEETGDILNDAVYNRNRTVEELVNIKISEYPTKGQDGVRTAVSTDVMSGDGQYDLCFQSIVGIIGLADNGLLRDLNKVGINTDAPWYDKLSIEEMTIDGKLFYVNSDISYIDKLATIVVFFNKAIAENYNMDDFYERVRGGTWTYDYMLECSEGMSDDLNGDGVLNAEDAYGIACQNDGSYYLLHSTGNKFGEKTADGLRFTAGDEAVVTALQDVMDLMQTDLYFNSQDRKSVV